MQSTTDFDNAIANPAFEEANGILDNATALDATIHMFDTNPTAGKVFIGRLLIGREGAAARLLVRGLDIHIPEVKAQKAAILE